MSTVAERVYQMATGELETPALDGSTASRWSWFADLYDHPQWGLGAAVPTFTDAAGAIGRLCRATATGTAASLRARWGALSRLAAIKGDTCPIAEHHAWTAVTNSAIDAHDFLDGIDYGGLEFVTSAYTAIAAAQTNRDAEIFIARSLKSWAAYQREPSLALRLLAPTREPVSKYPHTPSIRLGVAS